MVHLERRRSRPELVAQMSVDVHLCGDCTRRRIIHVRRHPDYITNMAGRHKRVSIVVMVHHGCMLGVY